MGRWYRAAAVGGVCLAILSSFVLGLLVLYGKRPEAEKREVGERVYNVQVFEVEETNLREIIHSFGTARADQEVIVPAQVAGEIIELHDNLRVGLPLREKEPDEPAVMLAVIDPQTYEERSDRAQKLLDELDTEVDRLNQEEANNATLREKAKLDLETIQKQYERVKKNKTRGAASASDVTRALLEVRQYEQSVIQLETQGDLIPIRRRAALRKQESLRADLKLARIDLANTKVVAPFDGTVSEVMVEIGQYVRVGDPLIRLTNTRKVEIPVPLPMSEFLKIETALQAGQQPAVGLAVNETADTEWWGRLVRAAPEADANTRTIMTYVEVDNEPAEDTAAKDAHRRNSPSSSNRKLRPGSFVHARIDGPTHEARIVIPRDAVSDGHVFIERDGKARQVTATVGRTLRSLVMVTGDLKPGDRVVLTNLDVLTKGAKLNISGTTRLSEELDKQRFRAARKLPAND